MATVPGITFCSNNCQHNFCKEERPSGNSTGIFRRFKNNRNMFLVLKSALETNGKQLTSNLVFQITKRDGNFPVYNEVSTISAIPSQNLYWSSSLGDGGVEMSDLEMQGRGFPSSPWYPPETPLPSISNFSLNPALQGRDIYW